METTQSVMLYDAEIWVDTLNKEAHRHRLVQVQRRGALRVATSYRTVRGGERGVDPITLLAKERKAIYSRKGKKLRELLIVKNIEAHLPSVNSLGKMNQEADGLRGLSTI